MATQFFSETTGEWAATRWFSGTATGSRGTCVDFGARTERAFEVCAAADAGENFVDEFGERWSGADFVREVQRHVWTFGEYGGAFAVGSGDAAAFWGC